MIWQSISQNVGECSVKTSTWSGVTTFEGTSKCLVTLTFSPVPCSHQGSEGCLMAMQTQQNSVHTHTHTHKEHAHCPAGQCTWYLAIIICLVLTNLV